MTERRICEACVPGTDAGCTLPAAHILYFAAPSLEISAVQNGANQLHARLQNLEPKTSMSFAGFNTTFETTFRMTRAEDASAVSRLLDAVNLDRMVAQDLTNIRNVYMRFGAPMITFTLHGPKNLEALTQQKDIIRLAFGLEPHGRRRLLTQSLDADGVQKLRVEVNELTPSESWLRLHFEIYPETEVLVMVPGVMGKSDNFFPWENEKIALLGRMETYLQVQAGVSKLNVELKEGMLAVRVRSDEKLPEAWAQSMDDNDDLQDFFASVLFDGKQLHAVDKLRVTQRLTANTPSSPLPSTTPTPTLPHSTPAPVKSNVRKADNLVQVLPMSDNRATLPDKETKFDTMDYLLWVAAGVVSLFVVVAGLAIVCWCRVRRRRYEYEQVVNMW